MSIVDVILYSFAVVGAITIAFWIWEKLDVWLDKVPKIIIVPDEKVKEFEQHLWVEK